MKEKTPDGKMKLVRRFRFHDLRHTFGSRLGMGRIDTKTTIRKPVLNPQTTRG